MNRFGEDPHGDASRNWFFSRGTLVACVVLVTVGILLLTGHEAHLLGVVPYLLLLACPLMHFFMHGGHAGHHSHRSPARPDKPDRNADASARTEPSEKSWWLIPAHRRPTACGDSCS